jgi:hypothetical protein
MLLSGGENLRLERKGRMPKLGFSWKHGNEFEPIKGLLASMG